MASQRIVQILWSFIANHCEMLEGETLPCVNDSIRRKISSSKTKRFNSEREK
ncbi:uncharacterized protein G2W53_037981 [Senna tora]|uniref:Uncharacterized protein n=1 Tax=Senna tora TaxID=362788 RepID=A0A834W1M9_9FABA|nr:uncharacterized protein G2W53_037981 [Senna tora]